MRRFLFSLLRLLTIVVALALVAGLALLLWPHAPAPAGPFVPTAAEQQELTLYRQPESWFVAHLQHPPEVIDGQHLDPKFQYMLEQARPSMALMPYTVPVLFAFANGRRWMRNGIDREWTLYTKITAPMHSVEDRRLPGRDGPVAARIYHPETLADTPLPVLVYGHGGGWVFASVAAMDRVARLIANEAKGHRRFGRLPARARASVSGGERRLRGRVPVGARERRVARRRSAARRGRRRQRRRPCRDQTSCSASSPPAGRCRAQCCCTTPAPACRGTIARTDCSARATVSTQASSTSSCRACSPA